MPEENSSTLFVIFNTLTENFFRANVFASHDNTNFICRPGGAGGRGNFSGIKQEQLF